MLSIKEILSTEINMEILNARKKRKQVKKLVNQKSNNVKIDNSMKMKAFKKAHSNISVNLDEQCLRCSYISKGGYQYVFKPTNDMYLCDICKEESMCKRCDDKARGMYHDNIMKAYRDQTNLCKFCSFEYFLKEIELTPEELEKYFSNH